MAHDHSRGQTKRALGLTLVLTSAFLVAEVIGGLLTGSLALLADAGHMLSDSVSLGLALFAVWLAQRPATPQRTFGLKRAEILAALANGVTLVAISIWIFVEAIRRLDDPGDVLGGWMLVVAIVGLFVNAAAIAVLHRGGDSSLNVKAATRHVIADFLGSIGVIVAALIIVITGWEYADPIVSLLIAVLILAQLVDDPPRHNADPPGGRPARNRRLGGGPRDGLRPRRGRGPRPPRLDDHLGLSGARRARPGRRGRRLPPQAPRGRRDAPPRFGIDHATLQMDHTHPHLLQIEKAPAEA